MNNLQLSVLRTISIKFECTFLCLSNKRIGEEDFYRIRSQNLYYNSEDGEFYLLAQHRPPLVIFCILSYFITLLG